MEQLKFIWHNNGKHTSDSSSVSVREFTDYGVFDVISPTDIVGTGSYYGAALEDFIEQFDEIIINRPMFSTVFGLTAGDLFTALILPGCLFMLLETFLPMLKKKKYRKGIAKDDKKKPKDN